MSSSFTRTEVRLIARCLRERSAHADRGSTHRPLPARAVRPRGPRSDSSPVACESGPPARTEVRLIARCLRERSAHADRGSTHRPLPARAVRPSGPRSDSSPVACESGPPARTEVRLIARCLRERSAHADRGSTHRPLPARAVRPRERARGPRARRHRGGDEPLRDRVPLARGRKPPTALVHAGGRGRPSLAGRQLSARGGTVQVRVAGERVKLGGGAVTVLEGVLRI